MKALRVLVLEDSVDDAELVLHELEVSGYACDWKRVDEPEAFLQAIEQQEWDVILSDFNMPRFDAPRALEILKASGKDIPFIIVSGSVGEPAAVQAMKAGAHDFFPKANLHRLSVAIDREIREAAVRKERRQVVSERHQLLDDLQQAVRARDEFLSIASHELKTPLTAMELQIERLKMLAHARPARDLADEQVMRALKSVERQAERLVVLINSLLDVTRITSGHLDLQTQRLELGKVVDGVIGRLRESIERAGCRLSVTIEDGVMGDWDKVHLEALVTNLVTNAIRYGAGKPVEVAVARTPDRRRARLRVCDRGLGISPEQQARIFDRFERAVPAEHYGGLGLGLWIVRKVVEAHGGSVAVEGRTGGGSMFTVELPLARSDRDSG